MYQGRDLSCAHRANPAWEGFERTRRKMATEPNFARQFFHRHSTDRGMSSGKTSSEMLLLGETAGDGDLSKTGEGEAARG